MKYIKMPLNNYGKHINIKKLVNSFAFSGVGVKNQNLVDFCESYIDFINKCPFKDSCHYKNFGSIKGCSACYKDKKYNPPDGDDSALEHIVSPYNGNKKESFVMAHTVQLER